MPVSSGSTLVGLPLNTLKSKAAVLPDNSLSLLQWINLCNNVYQAAVEADAQQSIELAYVEYCKAAGILQVIINYPDFVSMKAQQPNNYRIYQEVARKVLDSTGRAKQLGEIIDSNNTKTRPIAAGITSRIKSLEAAAASSRSHQSTSQRPLDEPCQPPRTSSIAGPRPFPISPLTSPDYNSSSTFVNIESTSRSESAPPDLSLDLPSFAGYTLSGTFTSGDKTKNDQSIEDTLMSLRSPTEFDQAFPALETLNLNDCTSFPDLPSVPKTSPTKPRVGLPPPPEPFVLPTYDSQTMRSDQLVNDTSLGANLIADSQALSSPPPPYPDFGTDRPESSKSPALLTRSHAIRNHLNLTRSSFSNGSPLSSPKRPIKTSASQQPDPPPTLPTGSNEILPAVLVNYFRKMSAAGFDTNVLFLDIRERDDFEACRIKSQDVVCIEPIVLTKSAGPSSIEIEESLIISPRREKALFERRHEFEYVILYDKRSVQLPDRPLNQRLRQSSDPADVPAKLLSILYTAIYTQAYVKQLKNPPMLLIGGIDGWAKVAGESGVIGKPKAISNNNTRLSLTHSSVNGTPIVFRQPITASDKTLLANGDVTAERQSDIKRARRQVALHQRDSTSPQQDPFARSVADLTRPLGAGGSSGSSGTPAYFSLNPRSSLSAAYQSSGYQSPMGVTSPITLPEQTLQRAKSSQLLYDPTVPSHSAETSSGLYSSLSASHSHPNGFHPAPTPPHPPLYGSQPLSYFGPRLVDPSYNAYIPRPSIQYPNFIHNPHNDPRIILENSPQPPPPVMTPGGAGPTHYNLSPYINNNNNQPFNLMPYPRNTPPVTPYSPGTHGPSEVYFNSSFEDGQVGLTGLKNLGNTCYMNSTLQCISATIPLARFFKDGSYKRCINRINPLGTKGLLAESVAELVRVLWGAQYTFVSPTAFREAICRFAPQFRGSDQHDAQEFLGFLLDGLHEDLNLVTLKPPPIEMSPEREAELEALPTQIASAREWEIYKKRDNSVIVELFQGQYRSRLQCCTCQTTSTTYNTFMYLSLPIPTGRGMSKVSLTQCLDAFLKEEIMEKDDAWNCPKCKTRKKATKRLSLARLPPILLIHLKRFSFKGPFSDKLEAFVQYPVYGLDLTSYIPPPLDSLPAKLKASKGLVGPSTVYDLYAVVNHFGSLSSGHYTAFVRSQKDWFNIGDSRVSKTDENTVKARSAYLLSFRRRE